MFLKPYYGVRGLAQLPTVHRLTGSFLGNVDACTYHLIPNLHTPHEGPAPKTSPPRVHTSIFSHLSETQPSGPHCFAVCTAMSDIRILAHLFLIFCFHLPPTKTIRAPSKQDLSVCLNQSLHLWARQLWAAATLCKRASILHLQTGFKIYLSSWVALEPDLPTPSAVPSSLYKPPRRP